MLLGLRGPCEHICLTWMPNYTICRRLGQCYPLSGVLIILVVNCVTIVTWLVFESPIRAPSNMTCSTPARDTFTFIIFILSDEKHPESVPPRVLHKLRVPNRREPIS